MNNTLELIYHDQVCKQGFFPLQKISIIPINAVFHIKHHYILDHIFFTSNTNSFIRLQIFNVKVGRFLLVTHCRCPYNCLVTKLVVHFVTFFLLCVKYLVCFMNIIIVRDRIKYSVFAHVSNNREHVSPYVQICIQHGYFIAAEYYDSGQKIFIIII